MEVSYELRRRTCAFTGHRDLPEDQIPAIRRELERLIALSATKGVDTFVAGGALGFDTLAATAVLKLRQSDFPHIRLALAIPCPEQADNWSAENQGIYRDIKLSANEVNILSPHYTPSCMHLRNRYMVNRSGFLIGYVAKTTGGSFYTLQYAKKQGLRIRNIAPNAVQIEKSLL